MCSTFSIKNSPLFIKVLYNIIVYEKLDVVYTLDPNFNILKSDWTKQVGALSY